MKNISEFPPLSEGVWTRHSCAFICLWVMHGLDQLNASYTLGALRAADAPKKWRNSMAFHLLGWLRVYHAMLPMIRCIHGCSKLLVSFDQIIGADMK